MTALEVYRLSFLIFLMDPSFIDLATHNVVVDFCCYEEDELDEECCKQESIFPYV